jgi:hypothetical protein
MRRYVVDASQTGEDVPRTALNILRRDISEEVIPLIPAVNANIASAMSVGAHGQMLSSPTRTADAERSRLATNSASRTNNVLCQ